MTDIYLQFVCAQYLGQQPRGRELGGEAGRVQRHLEGLGHDVLDRVGEGGAGRGRERAAFPYNP